MTELTLYFLKTSDAPSMLLVHPEHTILFDAPDGIDPPFDPTTVFMTYRKSELVKSAATFADVYGIGLMGAGQLDSESLTVTPFPVKADTKSYGYIIKSDSVSIAYAPHFDDFPREVLGADVVILDGRDPNTVIKAHKAGCSRVMTMKSTGDYALADGQALSLITKAKPTLSKMQVCYREASGDEGMCADCRFYLPPSEQRMESKGDVTHPDVTTNQIRIRVRPPSDFEPGSFRSIILDASKGISAIIGRPRGQATTTTQAFRFDRDKWSPSEASAWAQSHHGASKSSTGRCSKVMGPINTMGTCDHFEPYSLPPFAKFSFAKVQQAFGSPGGKRAMAKRILTIMPEHETYVEPYAGGAAVYFAKSPAAREVLNDLDTEIAQTYKDMQSLSDAEIKKLQGMPWTVNKDFFKRLRKATPTGKLSRLHRWLYMRGAAYGNYTQPSASHEGKIMKVANRLGQVRDRLRKTVVENADALEIIKRYDSPSTFFFLDPPYPTEWKFDGNTGHADSDEWNGQDLYKLLDVLKSAKGKFILTLESEIADVVQKHVGNSFILKKIPMPRQMSLGPKGHLSAEEELLVANYPIPDMQKSDEMIEISKPFAGYKDFAACVAANSDKSDPEGYCATIMRQVEKNLDLSDVHIDKLLDLEKAVWTTEYINDLPDSSFAYISPGGSKDSDGKTTPRSLRHLPYKDSDGSIDRAHAANALSRLPQTQGIPDSERERIRSMLQSHLKETKKSIEYAPIETFVIAKSTDEKRLVWTVNMVPNKVDGEGHWQDEDEIMKVAHNFMLKDVPIWSEHKEPVRAVHPVQSYTLLSDLKMGDRMIPAGSWVTVLWVPNDEEWAKVKKGDYRGTSIRGFSRRTPASPDPEKRTEVSSPGA